MKKYKEKDRLDQLSTCVKIQIPIGEEDIRMFEELVWQGRPSFTWTFDEIDVEFIKDKEEDE